jgi:hypothetical protein
MSVVPFIAVPLFGLLILKWTFGGKRKKSEQSDEIQALLHMDDMDDMDEKDGD